MSRNNLKPSTWAKLAGASDRALIAFLKKETQSISIQTYESLAAEQGVSVSELLGESPPPPTESDHPRQATGSMIDDFEFLPVYDARAAAGYGCINEDTPEPLHFNAYRLDWLRRVTSAPPSQLAVIRVAGDSNWPTLHDGDHVLIDRSVTRCSRDGLYVIRLLQEDEVMVKRLARDPKTKTLAIKSDNTEYPSFDGVSDDDISVIGRVIWLGRCVG